jgi:hypothetical protein
MNSIRYAVLAALLLVTDAACQIGEISVDAGPPAERPRSPSQDRSALWLRAGTRVTVLMTDPQGRKTGVDPATRQILQNIPNSFSDVDYVENRYTGEKEAEAYQRINIEPAEKGEYVIEVRGLQPGPFSVNVSALSSNGSSAPSKELEGLISEGEKRTLRLTFDPAPNAGLTLVDAAARPSKKKAP